MITDIIHGKLDQLNRHLEVDFAIGRDSQVKDIGPIIQTLNDWCEACDSTLGAIQTQVINANSEREKHIQHRAAIEEKISQFKGATFEDKVLHHKQNFRALRVKASAKLRFPKAENAVLE